MVAWLRKLLSGPDNVSPDIARVCSLLGFLVYVFLASWHAIADNQFNYIDYGSGLGIVLTAAGFSIAVKGKTEPGGK